MSGKFGTPATVLALSSAISSAVYAQRITQRESYGEVRNQVTVSSLVAAINNTPRVSSRLDGLSMLSAERVRVIDVRPYIPSKSRATYRAALLKSTDQIEQLRAQLIVMDPVVRVLADRRPALTVDDVVAAGILDVVETGKSSNVLVLYVDNRNRLGTPATATRTMSTFRPTSAALMSALQTSPEMVARVGALEALRLDRVRFYDIDAILKPADSVLYRTALRLNETSIRSLRAELSKQPAVLQAMARHTGQLLMDDIIAVDILGDDDILVLYYRRRVSADDAHSAGPRA